MSKSAGTKLCITTLLTFKFLFIYNLQNYTLERAAFGTSVFNEDASALKASMLLDTAKPSPGNGDSTVKAIPLLETAEESLQNGTGSVKASPFLQTFALSRVLEVTKFRLALGRNGAMNDFEVSVF